MIILVQSITFLALYFLINLNNKSNIFSLKINVNNSRQKPSEIMLLIRHLDRNEAKLSVVERSHTFALAKVNVSKIHTIYKKSLLDNFVTIIHRFFNYISPL